MRIVKIVLLFLLFILFLTSILAGFIYFKYKQVPSLTEPVTVLVLGKGGEGHTGALLTDTIMVGHLNPDSKKTTVFSLPRDIWITEIRAKLNTAYHYGGFDMAKDSVAGITNFKINNVVVVDFEVFKDIINSLGGVDVEVDNAFIDSKYPIAGKENDLCSGDLTYACRYETIEFKQGLVTMDGETALKFARSRNSEGDEGTDLAREKRQQKIILAIRNKVLSPEILLDLNKMKSVYEVVIKNLKTDFNVDTVLTYAKFMVESKFNFETAGIPEDLLSVSRNDRKYDYQYVFVPKSGNWKEFQEWIKSKI